MTATLDAELLALMNQTITVLKRSTIDAYGKETTTTRGVYRCYIAGVSTYALGSSSKDVTLADTAAYVYSDDIAITDEVQFANGLIRPIGNLDTFYDETGAVYCQVLYFG